MYRFDEWLLTPARAALHLPTACAVVADLHLGYGDARRRGGDAVPAADVASHLAPLLPLVARHHVRRLAVAGDLFEAGVRQELLDELRAWCAAARVELVAVVPGNHDRGLGGGELPIYRDGFTLGRWRVVHGDGPLPGGAVVQGHEHPRLRCSGYIIAPCYLVSANRLILPAFTRDAAGVNVLRDPRWQTFRCCAIAGEDVLDFGVVERLKALGGRT